LRQFRIEYQVTIRFDSKFQIFAQH